ncbi:MAG: hypothetical protein Q7V88_05905 [Actinomycetota bacterium]|nr:hypothetical protein [Actinomycetota bacterium]
MTKGRWGRAVAVLLLSPVPAACSTTLTDSPADTFCVEAGATVSIRAASIAEYRVMLERVASLLAASSMSFTDRALIEKALNTTTQSLQRFSANAVKEWTNAPLIEALNSHCATEVPAVFVAE